MRLLIRGCALSILTALCLAGLPVAHADQVDLIDPNRPDTGECYWGA